MALNSIGDLAFGMALRIRGNQIKNEVGTLTQELSTGRAVDVATKLNGDVTQITGIDRELSRLDAFSVASAEAQFFAESLQASLTWFQDSVASLSSALLASGPQTPGLSQDQARNHLDAMISALNTQVAGRNLFSGTATDKTPLAPPETLLTALKTELAGASTANQVQQLAEDWFNDPNGFAAAMYQGSSENLAPMKISEGEQISLTLKADQQVFKDALRNAALAELASDPSFTLASEQKEALLKDVAVQLVNADHDITGVRAQVGSVEARIENTISRNASMRTSLEYAKTQLIGADPFETASRLQEVQFQLESLYSVTARNAKLSLVNFLR